MSEQSKHQKTIDELLNEELKSISMKLPNSQLSSLEEWQKGHKEKHGDRKIPLAKIISLFLKFGIDKMDKERIMIMNDNLTQMDLKEGYEFVFGDVWLKDDSEDEKILHDVPGFEKY